MGYNCANTLSPVHWFQFAEDTAVAATTQEHSQALLQQRVPEGKF